MHIHIRVKPEFIDAFKQASLANAQESVKEPGIAPASMSCSSRMIPTRFVLIEAYRSAEATAAHKQTKHYETWRATAEPMMAEPRTRATFTNVFPADEGW
ncbi:MAG TPA: antibiotic biosynthesis monooxygenase [Candidatus Angelobacter sp.]|nr:antibiotic biosynthesis monooxygenase [Candidatus Angelobacter sp.]